VAITTAPAGSPPATVDKETWRAYYVLQYERVAQHEKGRLQVTNTILAASVVALGLTTLAFGEVIKWLAVAPFAVALVNLFAFIYVRHAREWVKLHQARARAVLKILDPKLLELQERVNVDQGYAAKAADRNALLRGGNLIAGTHLVVVALSALLGIAWFLS
jgi:hypothetical protein